MIVIDKLIINIIVMRIISI